MKDKKRKRRLIWVLLIFLVLGGTAVIADVLPKNPIIPEPKPEPRPLPEKAEAEQVMQEVFCFCSPEDLAYYEDVAKKQTKGPKIWQHYQVGGMECGMGYYDTENNIAYIAAIYGKDMFNPRFRYCYRDFYLQRGVYRFDIYSLDRPDMYNKPILFRIHKPERYDDTLKYVDVYCDRGYYDTEQSRDGLLMVDSGNVAFEDYAKSAGIDLSQVIFVDIK